MSASPPRVLFIAFYFIQCHAGGGIPRAAEAKTRHRGREGAGEGPFREGHAGAAPILLGVARSMMGGRAPCVVIETCFLCPMLCGGSPGWREYGGPLFPAERDDTGWGRDMMRRGVVHS